MVEITGAQITSLTVGSRGVLEQLGGRSVLSGSVINRGSMEVLSGGLVFAGDVDGVGKISVAAGASVDFTSGVASGQTVDFVGSGGVVSIDDTGGFMGRIGSFAAGDAITLNLSIHQLTSVSWSEGASAHSGTLTLTDDGQTTSLVLIGHYSLADFVVSDSGYGGISIGW